VHACEGGGKEKRNSCCVAYQVLNQFKLCVAGPNLVTVENPNFPLTVWTLTGNHHTEVSTDILGEKTKMVWTIERILNWIKVVS